jgi:hypothetical protein
VGKVQTTGDSHIDRMLEQARPYFPDPATYPFFSFKLKLPLGEPIPVTGVEGPFVELEFRRSKDVGTNERIWVGPYSG